MHEISFVFLIIFSAFTVNLTLQCALGINGMLDSLNSGRITTMIKLGIIFIAVIMLWGVFSVIISGMFIYVLLFPVSSMVYYGLEFLAFHYIFKRDAKDEHSISFPEGITAVAVFICLNIANSFIEAAALAFGFAAGTLLVFLILGEISKRAALEAIPRFLRGKPLILISMGMLSLVFSTASLLLFRMIGS